MIASALNKTPRARYWEERRWGGWWGLRGGKKYVYVSDYACGITKLVHRMYYHGDHMCFVHC